MTATILDLTAFRARRAEQATAREAAKADAIARAQPQALACSLALLEPVASSEPVIVPRATAEPEPIRWRTSARGNPWAMVGDLHVVIFPDRGDTDQWCVRIQRGDGRGRYLKHVWPSAEDAQQAVERALQGGTSKSVTFSNLS
jgi:hypothetical protein